MTPLQKRKPSGGALGFGKADYATKEEFNDLHFTATPPNCQVANFCLTPSRELSASAGICRHGCREHTHFNGLARDVD
jgi:hypothetical protein